MKTKDIKKFTEKAIHKYDEYREICGIIAKEAQKHIDWEDNVGCEYIPADGLCICVDSKYNVLPYTIPVSSFFKMVKTNGMITENDLKAF